LIELIQAHPATLSADVLCYPNTSFGFLVTSPLGRELIQTGGPRVEQSIVNQRPLRLGSAVLGNPGKLGYQHIVHYICYPGWDKWWSRNNTIVAMRSLNAMLDRLQAQSVVLMLPVQPPFDAAIWPDIIETTAEMVPTDDGRLWKILVPSNYIASFWPKPEEKELHVATEDVPLEVERVSVEAPIKETNTAKSKSVSPSSSKAVTKHPSPSTKVKKAN